MRAAREGARRQSGNRGQIASEMAWVASNRWWWNDVAARDHEERARAGMHSRGPGSVVQPSGRIEQSVARGMQFVSRTQQQLAPRSAQVRVTSTAQFRHASRNDGWAEEMTNMQNLDTAQFSTLSLDDLAYITGGADGNSLWDRAGRVLNTVGNDAQNGAGLGAAVGGVGGAVVGGVAGSAAGGVGAIPGAGAGAVAGATTGGALGGAVGGLWGLGRGIVNEFRR